MFGCGKFRWLSIEKFDRQLTPKEEQFFRKHREVCYPCLRYEQHGLNAMNMLTSGAIEPEISEDFDDKVLRSLRTTAPRRVALANWSPALAGAAVAGLALAAALQLLGKVPVLNEKQNLQNNGAYNRRIEDIRFYNNDPSTFPDLVLPEKIDR